MYIDLQTLILLSEKCEMVQITVSINHQIFYVLMYVLGMDLKSFLYAIRSVSFDMK